MTATLDRPSRRVRPPRRDEAERGRSPRAAGLVAALRAAVLGLLVVGLPVLLVWASDSRSGVGVVDALRSGGRIWLLAHGASLELADGRVALTPVGLLLLPLALVAAAAAAAARATVPTSVRAAARLALWTGAAYAVLSAVVAVASSTAQAAVTPVQALLAGLLVGTAGGLAGALRPSRLWRAAWHLLPARARRLLPAAVLATALLVGAGALLVGSSLAVHGSRAVELSGASDPGAAGGAALLLTGVALAPNAAVWGLSWLSGPGFAVGTGTAVSPFAHDLGPVPAVPLLAALPAQGLPGWLGALALAVPLLAGGLAGRRLLADLDAQLDGQLEAERSPGPLGRGRTALEVGLVGPACGALVAGLAWLSGGAVGGERLAAVGPSPWRVGLAVALAVGTGAVLAVLLRRSEQPRRSA
jgi:hypothetical protein